MNEQVSMTYGQLPYHKMVAHRLYLVIDMLFVHSRKIYRQKVDWWLPWLGVVARGAVSDC